MSRYLSKLSPITLMNGHCVFFLNRRAQSLITAIPRLPGSSPGGDSPSSKSIEEYASSTMQRVQCSILLSLSAQCKNQYVDWCVCRGDPYRSGLDYFRPPRGRAAICSEGPRIPDLRSNDVHSRRRLGCARHGRCPIGREYSTRAQNKSALVLADNSVQVGVTCIMRWRCGKDRVSPAGDKAPD